MTLIPWQAGKNVIWDVTVADTLAASYLPITYQEPGRAAESASDRKDTKLARSYTFMPLAFETLGPIGNKAIDFLSELGRRIGGLTGDPREGSYLFQRILVAIQRFNCVCFRGTFITPPDTKS